MTFQTSFILTTLPQVLRALPVTLLLTFLPVTAGILLGGLLAAAKLRRIPVLSQLVTLYLSFFRGVPLLILLFLSYYGIPKLVNFVFYGGMRVWSTSSLSSLTAALVVLTLYAGAYLCEIIRGALGSVDARQLEAAHAIGMTRFQGYARIILPQAVIVALPNYFNFVLSTLKNTSLVFTISVLDIMAVAKLAAEDGYRFIEAYALVGGVYILFSLGLSRLFGGIERRSKGRMGIQA